MTPLRLGALHDALLHPGDADLARRAAEEVAAYEGRMSAVERDLSLIKWMLGTVIALVVGQLTLAFTILQRLPR